MALFGDGRDLRRAATTADLRSPPPRSSWCLEPLALGPVARADLPLGEPPNGASASASDSGEGRWIFDIPVQFPTRCSGRSSTGPGRAASVDLSDPESTLSPRRREWFWRPATI